MQTVGLTGFRLSSQQTRLWSIQPEHCAYMASCAVQVEGELDLAALCKVLQRMVGRHEILRTIFYQLPGMDVPVQAVSDRHFWSLSMINLENLEKSSQDDHLDMLMRVLQKEPDDLAHGPALRVWMLQLSVTTHILLFSLPALCADISTLQLFVTELQDAYSALLQGDQQEDLEEPLQYADVAMWQEDLLLEKEAEEHQRYWLKGELTSLSTQHLPFETENVASNALIGKDLRFTPDTVVVPIKEDLQARIQAYAQNQGVSLKGLLLSCWQILLNRLCDRPPVLGVSCDGRFYEELAQAFGLYTRFVPLHVLIESDQTFAQVLAIIEKELQELTRQQIYFSWETVMPPQDAGSSPPHGFPLSFAYDRWPDHLSCGPAQLSLVRLDVEGEPSALKLQVLDLDTTLRVHLLFDPRRLQREQVERLGQAFMVLLQHALTEPSRTVGSLPLVTADQQEQLVRLASGPRLPLPSVSVQQLFEAHAQRHPKRLAVQSPALCLRYDQLNARANQLARRLQSLGVGPNVLVGLCLERSALALVGILGVLKAGGAYVPLDGEQPRERLGQLMQESQISVLVTSSVLRTHLPAFAGVVLDLDVADPTVTQVSSENLPQRSQGEDLAYVLYTSGSTGRPKGVQVRQRNLLNYSLGLLEHLPREQGLHFALVSTLAADLGNSAIYGALVSGGCVDVLDAETVTSASAMATWMREHPVDVLKIVPSHLEALLSSEQGAEILPTRVLILGGEVASASVLRQIWASVADCRVLNHYGPTEATVGALVQPLTPGTERGALGRPLANTQVYVLDRHLQLLPAGSRGEICLGGEGIAQGYLGEGGQTAERFVPYAWSQEAGQRLYRTGDMGWMNARGEIEFVGRTDQQVKVRGYRVELAEVEAALRRQTTIRAAAVQVESHGQAGARLVGYVVPRVQPGPRLEEVQAALHASLPAYMIPSHLVMLEELPLTPNGKVDRRRLASGQAVEHVLKDVGMQQPGSPIEEVLQEIWQELLEVPWIGRQEDFFRLGGHSLLAMQVISQIRARLRVELSIVQVFEVPTIAGLASKIERVMRGGYEDEEPVLGRVEREEEMPVSFAQQRLWVLEQLEPGSVAYLTPHRVRIVGRLRVEALEWSLGEVMARHEVLRSCFVERGGEPRQQVRPLGVWLPLIDLEGLEREEAEQAAQLLGWQEGQRALDLRSGPVVRSTLIRLGGEHILLLTLHHIVTDGWSNQILVRELGLLYGAFEAGHASPLAPLPVQYIDFAVWQRRWLQGEILARQLNYWCAQLQDVQPLELSTDHVRPATQTFRGAHQVTLLPVKLHEQLKLLCQDQGSTLFMTLLAAFQLLLMRYSGQTDIAVGTPIANRTRAELDGLIGFFVNTLVLRTDLSGNPTFRELLARVRDVALHAYAHQDMPFERIVEELQPERDLSRSPLFQVMFILQNTSVVDGRLQDVTFHSLEQTIETSKFDLTLEVRVLSEGLACQIEYSTDLFDQATIEHLLGHWHTLLNSIVSQPDQRISTLSLLSTEEQQWLQTWHGTSRELPPQTTVHQLIEAQVARTPDAIAVGCEDECLTYAQFNAQANIVARSLTKRGVVSDVPVAVLLERSLPFVTTLLGIFKANGVYLPLDPLHPVARIRQVLTDSACPFIITSSTFSSVLSQVFDDTFTLPRPLILLTEELNSTDPVEQYNLSLHSLPANLAYVIYTSGSTGTPKGVMVEQRGMLNHMYAKSKDMELSASDIVAQNGPQGFDVSIWQSLAALLFGGRVQILKDEAALNPVRLLEQVEARGITLLQVVPSMLRGMLTEISSMAARPALSELRWLIPTGDALPGELCRQWFEYYPFTPLLNTYGSTECSDDQCHYPISMPLAADILLPIVPVGFPIPNLQVYILDRALNLVPIGVAGELYIGGIGVGRGYLNDPLRTAQAFIPDPFCAHAGGRLYKTGDLVRHLPDGNIEFLGRVDNLVKVRGYRIELGEIEAVLTQHPLVHESVIVVHDQARGKQLIAYVVTKDAAQPSQAELREYLRSKLPEYMHPSWFILLDSLPLNANGKIDRHALPMPVRDETQDTGQHLESWSPVEEIIGAIWSEVLGCQQQSVHANFFVQGGHSLLATKVIAHLQHAFDIELPLRCIFETPTVAGLALRVERALQKGGPKDIPPLSSIEHTSLQPLSFAQQRLWFLDRLEPQSSAYLIANIKRLHGILHVTTLESSLSAVVARHESLRTTFRQEEGAPVQVIASEVTLALPLIDLQGLPAWQREEYVRRLAQEEGQQPCDLHTGPLLRLALIRVQEQEHVLFLTMHHIISDGWSNDILLHEVSQLYRASLHGAVAQLPELPVHYADYALWQRGWLQGAVLEQQVAYWQEQLAGTTILELPSDYPRPARQSFRGASASRELSEELRRGVQQLSQREGVTSFMTLLAAFQVLLMRYSGQSDIAVGTPIANRRHAELEGLIGFFVNTLVLRSDLTGNPSFEELVRQVREKALGAYMHQDVPFELLVETLRPERDLSHPPLFQVMFSFQPARNVTEALEGLAIQEVETEHLTTKFDLSLVISEKDSGLHAHVEYNTDLFARASIERLLAHWETLLAGIIAHPDQKVRDLPLLSSEHRRHLLAAQQSPLPLSRPAARGLHALLWQQGERTPDAIALVDQEQCLSYGALLTQASGVARQLRSLGVGVQTAVGLAVQRSQPAALAWVGIWLAGGVVVPLDPTAPLARQQTLLDEAQVRVLIGQREDWADGALPAGITPLWLDEMAYSSEVETDLEALPWEQMDEAALAYVLYTSGSTGRPKGVMVPHAAIVNRVCWGVEDIGLDEHDWVGQLASWNFDIALWELFSAWSVGGRVVLVREEQLKDSRELIRQVQREGMTVVHVVPSLLGVLVQEEELGAWTQVRCVLCGGEAVSQSLVQQFFARLEVPLYQFYGPTEAAISVTRWRGERSTFTGVTLGNRIANTQVYVLDEQGELVPQGVWGEICLGGVQVAWGYVQAGGQTAEHFVPDRWSEHAGARIYRTGDVGRYGVSGALEYGGRRDGQMKVRGHRIEAGEIEGVLREHEGIRASVVVLREERLVAYVVRTSHAGASWEEEVRGYVQQRLPEYMQPGLYVELEQLPLTATGKVDRRALPEPVLLNRRKEALTAPRVPVEELLEQVWCRLLGREQIGIYDNFFQIGGHSLLVTQLVSRIRAIFQIELPILAVFEAPTIATLAQRVEHLLQQEQPLDIPLLAPATRTQALPLSFAQQRLWFLDQLEPGNVAYLMTGVYRLQGFLHIGILESSLGAVVARHESLRTTFGQEEGAPVQVIASEVTLAVPLIDLQGLPAWQREEHVRRLAREEGQQPCDLHTGPLLRLALVRLQEQEHVLFLTMHHIISDGWSNDILLHEVSQLYRASLHGAVAQLPELPVHYADYALWQRGWLQGAVLEQQVAYWQEQLAGTAVLELPSDYPRPARQSFRGASASRELSEELRRGVQQLSQREGVTSFMTLLAAFQVLLMRYSGQSDIAVGTPIANRRHAELEGLIGFFANTMVLRCKLDAKFNFLQLMRQVRDVALQAYMHQDVPFEYVVEALQPERDLSRSPIFQILFTLQNTLQVDEQLEGLHLQSIDDISETSKFDLSLLVTETAQGLLCRFEYNTDLFAESTIQRLLMHWQTLLEGVVANPEQRLCAIPLLNRDERRLLLHEWNASEIAYPQASCIHELFEEQAKYVPEAIAIVYEDEHLTYATLDLRANQLAQYLRDHGVGPETLVGICLPRTPHLLVALLAVLKAGGAYVPLDPAYPIDRLALILQEIQGPVILSQQSVNITLLANNASVFNMDQDWHRLASYPVEAPISRSQLQHTAYVIYTSGSTGKPKGVAIPHGALLNFLQAMQQDLAISTEDSWCAVTSISFDIAALELYLPLLQGARVGLASYESTANGVELANVLALWGSTVMQATPATWTMLLAAGWQGNRTLRVLCGGEQMSSELASQLTSRAGSVRNMYGPTETTIWSTSMRISGKEKRISIGRPIANTQLYVLDAQKQPVPIGVVGELYIGGAGLARGYWQSAEMTAERFVPDPFGAAGGTRLYRTGDQVLYREDGCLDYLGRQDEQVKLRGYRIELGEIEAVLNQHVWVKQSVVVLRGRELQEKYLVAYVVVEEGQRASIERSGVLTGFLQGKLPAYMLPTYFVILEAFPLTPNGKVDKRNLPDPPRGVVESQVDGERRDHFNPVEDLVLQSWKQVLQREHVGVHESFFEVGGHSLLATQVISRLRSLLGVDVPLRTLFEAPTVAELSIQVQQRLVQGHMDDLPALVPSPRNQDLPLSFAQQRLWFLYQLEPENVAYLIPIVRRLTGPLCIDVLESSLRTVVERHESLRTTFRQQEGAPVQVIASEVTLALPVIDLQGLPAWQREEHVRRLAREEGQQPCDLHTGPLLRLALIRLQEQEHVLFLTMHHIISDGWSNDILIHELSQLYRASLHGAVAQLPELPLHYGDYALWQRGWLQGAVLEQQIAYWQEQLTGTAVLELPSDYPRPARQSFRGATTSRELSEELRRGVQELSQREGVTSFMTLLAAFQVLLMRYSGQSDIAVGTPIANRTRVETEGLIGSFINTLVLRSDLAGNPSFEELVRQVREKALGAYMHQDVPFELLVETLRPERDLSHPPLFQVMFGFQPARNVVEALEGLAIQEVETEHLTTKFDLSLVISEKDSGLHAHVEYNTDLFARASIERLLAHWETLLAGIIAHPDQKVCDLPLLSPEHRRQLLAVQQSPLPLSRPAARGLHALLWQQGERTPDAIALVDQEQCLSYGALLTQASGVARQLQSLGVGVQTAVGLASQRSQPAALAWIGIWLAGGVVVPLDPTAPLPRQQALLHEAQVRVLVGQREDWADGALPAGITPLWLDEMVYSSETESETDLEVLPWEQVDEAALAYVLYTSGSTGRPKGVMVPHAAIVNRVCWGVEDIGLQGDDWVGQLASWSFDIALWELFGAWSVGGRVVLVREEQLKDSRELIRQVQREGLTVVHVVPSLLGVLVQEEELGAWTQVRCVLCGGEAVSQSLVQQFFARLEVPLYQFYGPTEAAISVTRWCGERSTFTGVTLGNRIANTQVYVLDEQGDLVPQGVWGEICLGGVQVAWGYVQAGGQTAEHFVPDRWSEHAGARIYRTGDVGRYGVGGALEYGGRRDGQMKVRGHRIEAGEIEGVLRGHEGIRASAVVLREERLVAYVVRTSHVEAQWEEKVRGYVQQRLPEYMRPGLYVELEQLPLTTTGKVDRRALPDPMLRKMVDDTEEPRQERHPIEELLEQIWCELLGVEQVGREDDFFALGGHSLLVTRLATRIRKALGVEISVQKLFDATTLAEEVALVERTWRGGQEHEEPELEEVEREAEMPLSFAQQRIWFLQQLDSESPAYLMPGAYRFRGHLNTRALEQSLAQLIARHEILRTTIQKRASMPVQIIHETDCYFLPVVDLCQIAPAQRSQEVQRLVTQEAQQPCDLAQGPLWRMCLLSLDTGEYVLLLTMHHIISDGWSMHVVMHELATLYRAYIAAEPAPLEALPLQYADYAVWQRRWLQGDVLTHYLDYWQRHLAGARSLTLPSDHPSTTARSLQGAGYTFVLPADLLERLQAMSKQEGVTLFMVLLTTFQILLARISGQKDIVVGTDIANRRHVETERLIGLFVNLLALRSDLSGTPLFRNLLQQVREMVLGAYVHQDLPFEMVVEHLRLERNGSRTPLVNVLFVLQNIPETTEDLPELMIKDMENSITTSKFDLAMFLHEQPDGIGGVLVYSTDLFEENTIALLVSKFTVLLQSILAQPDSPIDTLDIYTNAEKVAHLQQEKERLVLESNELQASKGEVIDLSNFQKKIFKPKKR